mmetsp:Transcript_53377/g.106182  ORF Transcript_53377/g.106182 Transcript_53377/m.106182 type:complete len:277 (+) Transcript_53377:312-1142(+)
MGAATTTAGSPRTPDRTTPVPTTAADAPILAQFSFFAFIARFPTRKAGPRGPRNPAMSFLTTTPAAPFRNSLTLLWPKELRICSVLFSCRISFAGHAQAVPSGQVPLPLALSPTTPVSIFLHVVCWPPSMARPLSSCFQSGDGGCQSQHRRWSTHSTRPINVSAGSPAQELPLANPRSRLSSAADMLQATFGAIRPGSPGNESMCRRHPSKHVSTIAFAMWRCGAAAPAHVPQAHLRPDVVMCHSVDKERWHAESTAFLTTRPNVLIRSRSYVYTS